MEQEIIFNKNRSIKACVADSWKIVALGWLHYLKALWPYLLIFGLTGAFFIEIFVQYATQHLLPAYRLYQIKGDPQLIEYVALPGWDLGIYLLLSLLLLVAGTYCFAGRLLRVMQFYRDTDALPSRPRIALGRAGLRYGLRLLACDALFLVCFALLAGLIGFAAFKWSVWISVLLPFLIAYAWATVHVARLQYAFYGKPFLEALKYALKRSMGFSFLVQFITLIPSAFLWLVFGMPVAIYLLTELAANDSLLMGDPSGLPAYLPFLFFVLNSTGLALCALVSSVRTWALALKQVP